eukprot:Gb_34870 [translate_table: standard]
MANNFNTWHRAIDSWAFEGTLSQLHGAAWWLGLVCGFVKKLMKITTDQLVKDFKPRQLPITLVWARNHKKETNLRCRIMWKKKGALNVCFEGAGNPPGGGGFKYGTNNSVDVAMVLARVVLLAYMQNGELLHLDHGFPVRMIIPVEKSSPVKSLSALSGRGPSSPERKLRYGKAKANALLKPGRKNSGLNSKSSNLRHVEVVGNNLMSMRECGGGVGIGNRARREWVKEGVACGNYLPQATYKYITKN